MKREQVSIWLYFYRLCPIRQHLILKDVWRSELNCLSASELALVDRPLGISNSDDNNNYNNNNNGKKNQLDQQFLQCITFFTIHDNLTLLKTDCCVIYSHSTCKLVLRLLHLLIYSNLNDIIQVKVCTSN